MEYTSTIKPGMAGQGLMKVLALNLSKVKSNLYFSQSIITMGQFQNKWLQSMTLVVKNETFP